MICEDFLYFLLHPEDNSLNSDQSKERLRQMHNIYVRDQQKHLDLWM